MDIECNAKAIVLIEGKVLRANSLDFNNALFTEMLTIENNSQVAFQIAQHIAIQLRMIPSKEKILHEPDSLVWTILEEAI